MKTLPRLKDYIRQEGRFVFSDNIVTKIAVDVKENGCYIESFTKVFNDYFTVQTNAKLSLVDGEELVKAKQITSDIKEYYEIVINKENILIFYSDKLSLRNAVATLISLTEQNNECVYINCATIKDYPNFSHRSMLIDIARRYIPIEELKMQIRTLGLCKYNYLHWHLSDNFFAYEVKCLPQLAYKNPRKIYTQDELKELVDYAQSFGIESIPEIDVPAHCSYITSVLPELLCDVEEPRNTDKPISTYTICLSNPTTYEILSNIIAELCDIFKGEYFHTGGDELYFYDIEEDNLWPEWLNCSRCKELAKKENINSDLDFYIYFANKINKIVKSFGKKMIIFNDAIDISKPTKLDKDITIQFWRIAMPSRGPVEGCSMQGFLDQGFSVINSFFPETYMCDYVKEEKLRIWTPLTNPKVENGKENLVLGGELCAWGVHNHFDYSTLPLLCYFSDRLWNSEEMEDSDKINKAFVRQTISHKIDTVNIFNILNFRIFPLNDYDKFFYDVLNKDLEKVEDAVSSLTKLYHAGIGEIRSIRAYIYVLQEIRNMLRKEQNLPMVDTTLWGFISESELKKEGKMR